ncbi:Glyoxalase-like domain protein [Bacillus sp. THAF10]|uniref:VOC family protein n=1 Tax=Bacillus sp. THAF10 TaxID=2587848 RepID=UPI00126810CC|nr:VOC family protein [Bacillus sp. THAF10]QFT87920.1 Glyoxalase-like domain protein [Bacillus sp. THAF10]
MFKVGSIFIPVTDLKKSTKWYEANLGVKKIDEWEDGVGFYFPNCPTQMGLVKVETPQPLEFTVKGKMKNGYFNFLVDDIHAAYQHFQDNGVVTSEIEDFNGMQFFDFFDPDGNPFSVVNENMESPFHRENVKQLQKS